MDLQHTYVSAFGAPGWGRESSGCPAAGAPDQQTQRFGCTPPWPPPAPGRHLLVHLSTCFKIYGKKESTIWPLPAPGCHLLSFGCHHGGGTRQASKEGQPSHDPPIAVLFIRLQCGTNRGADSQKRQQKHQKWKKIEHHY